MGIPTQQLWWVGEISLFLRDKWWEEKDKSSVLIRAVVKFTSPFLYLCLFFNYVKTCDEFINFLA